MAVPAATPTGLIRQRVTVRAPPKVVYEALMDSRRHARMIGATAKVERRPGGAFAMWDDGIHGTTLALVPNRKIVQQWRCGMKGWPDSHFSRLMYTLAPVAGGTAITLSQSGVPVACIAEIKQGWHDHYWAPMRRLLEGGA